MFAASNWFKSIIMIDYAWIVLLCIPFYDVVQIFARLKTLKPDNADLSLSYIYYHNLRQRKTKITVVLTFVNQRKYCTKT